MKIVKVTREINSAKLMDELLSIGLITPTTEEGLSSLRGNILYVSDDADIVAIQTIIDAHDTTPLPPQPSQDDYLLDLDFRLSLLELGL